MLDFMHELCEVLPKCYNLHEDEEYKCFSHCFSLITILKKFGNRF